MARTRHVWLLPALDVGEPEQGLVLTWRRRVRMASPPTWEALVLHIDERREDSRIEWIPASYLQPVESDPPRSTRTGANFARPVRSISPTAES